MRLQEKTKQIPASALRKSIQSPLRRMAPVAIGHSFLTALFQYKSFSQESEHANCIIIQKQGRAQRGDQNTKTH
jgi:hypothetical protein